MNKVENVKEFSLHITTGSYGPRYTRAFSIQELRVCAAWGAGADSDAGSKPKANWIPPPVPESVLHPEKNLNPNGCHASDGTVDVFKLIKLNDPWLKNVKTEALNGADDGKSFYIFIFIIFLVLIYLLKICTP